MINKALLTEQIRRFWAIPALSTLAYLLMIYAPMFNEHEPTWAFRHLVQIISMSNGGMMMILVVTSVLTAFCVFGCFFNKRAVTVFYSLPMNKRGMLCTNALAGVILSLIPVVIFCAVMLLPLRFQDDVAAMYHERMIMTGTTTTHHLSAGTHVTHMPVTTTVTHFPNHRAPEGIFPGGRPEWGPINTLPVIASLLVRMAIAAVFYFAVAWLAFSLAGHGIIALLVVGVLPFVPMAIAGFFGAIGQFFVFGFRSAGTNFGLRFIAHHQPALWAELIRLGAPHTHAVLIPALGYIVLGAALFAAAYFVSRARRPELTGNSIMFAPVKNVLVFALSFAAAMALGAIFYSINETLFMMHVGLAVGFAIGYVVTQMIAEKSFYIIEKAKYFPAFGGIAAALYLAIFAFTQFGMGFYVNRVPEKSDIYAVFVTTGWIHHGLSADEWRAMGNTDPDFIAEARETHQIIIDGRSYLQELPNVGNVWRNYTREVDGRIVTREPMIIKYMLHDGSMVMRQYSLPSTFIDPAGIGDFLDSEGVLMLRFPVFRRPELIESVGLSFDFSIVYTSQERQTHTDFHFERATISDPGQMETVLQIIADGMAENAREQREQIRTLTPDTFWGRGVVDADFEPGYRVSPYPNTSIRLNMDWDYIDGGRIPFWDTPHIWGAPALRLFEQLREWEMVSDPPPLHPDFPVPPYSYPESQ